MRTLMAAALIWGTSTAYFLTHKIAIPYYQIPAMFAVLVLLALSGLTRQVLHDKPQSVETVSDQVVRGTSSRGWRGRWHSFPD